MDGVGPPPLQPAPGTLHRDRGPGPDPGSDQARPGDSPPSIAAARLGDGDDWPAITALNLGRTMADGLQFLDPTRFTPVGLSTR